MGPPSESYIETVFTCEGDYNDPKLYSRLQNFRNNLAQILSKEKEKLILKKVEPWNSVKVTFNIPKEAASQLKLLAEQGDQKLRELGILSLQIEGDKVISLTIAGRNNERTELVFHTSDKRQKALFDSLSSDEVHSAGPSNVEATRQNIANYLSHRSNTGIFNTIFGSGQTSEKVGFKSPNTVVTQSSPIPFPSGTANSTGKSKKRRQQIPAIDAAADVSHVLGAFTSPFSSGSTTVNTISSKAKEEPTCFPFTNTNNMFVQTKGGGNKTGVSSSSPLLVNLLQNTLTAQGGEKLLNSMSQETKSMLERAMPPPGIFDMPPKKKRRPRKPKTPPSAALGAPLPSSYSPVSFDGTQILPPTAMTQFTQGMPSASTSLPSSAPPMPYRSSYNQPLDVTERLSTLDSIISAVAHGHDYQTSRFKEQSPEINPYRAQISLFKEPSPEKSHTGPFASPEKMINPYTGRLEPVLKFLDSQATVAGDLRNISPSRVAHSLTSGIDYSMHTRTISSAPVSIDSVSDINSSSISRPTPQDLNSNENKRTGDILDPNGVNPSQREVDQTPVCNSQNNTASVSQTIDSQNANILLSQAIGYQHTVSVSQRIDSQDSGFISQTIDSQISQSSVSVNSSQACDVVLNDSMSECISDRNIRDSETMDLSTLAKHSNAESEYKRESVSNVQNETMSSIQTPRDPLHVSMAPTSKVPSVSQKRQSLLDSHRVSHSHDSDVIGPPLDENLHHSGRNNDLGSNGETTTTDTTGSTGSSPPSSTDSLNDHPVVGGNVHLGHRQTTKPSETHTNIVTVNMVLEPPVGDIDIKRLVGNHSDPIKSMMDTFDCNSNKDLSPVMLSQLCKAVTTSVGDTGMIAAESKQTIKYVLPDNANSSVIDMNYEGKGDLSAQVNGVETEPMVDPPLYTTTGDVIGQTGSCDFPVEKTGNLTTCTEEVTNTVGELPRSASPVDLDEQSTKINNAGPQGMEHMELSEHSVTESVPKLSPSVSSQVDDVTVHDITDSEGIAAGDFKPDSVQLSNPSERTEMEESDAASKPHKEYSMDEVNVEVIQSDLGTSDVDKNVKSELSEHIPQTTSESEQTTTDIEVGQDAVESPITQEVCGNVSDVLVETVTKEPFEKNEDMKGEDKTLGDTIETKVQDKELEEFQSTQELETTRTITSTVDDPISQPPTQVEEETSQSSPETNRSSQNDNNAVQSTSTESMKEFPSFAEDYKSLDTDNNSASFNAEPMKEVSLDNDKTASPNECDTDISETITNQASSVSSTTEAATRQVSGVSDTVAGDQCLDLSTKQTESINIYNSASGLPMDLSCTSERQSKTLMKEDNAADMSKAKDSDAQGSLLEGQAGISKSQFLRIAESINTHSLERNADSLNLVPDHNDKHDTSRDIIESKPLKKKGVSIMQPMIERDHKIENELNRETAGAHRHVNGPMLSADRSTRTLGAAPARHTITTVATSGTMVTTSVVSVAPVSTVTTTMSHIHSKSKSSFSIDSILDDKVTKSSTPTTSSQELPCLAPAKSPPFFGRPSSRELPISQPIPVTSRGSAFTYVPMSVPHLITSAYSNSSVSHKSSMSYVQKSLTTSTSLQHSASRTSGPEQSYLAFNLTQSMRQVIKPLPATELSPPGGIVKPIPTRSVPSPNTHVLDLSPPLRESSAKISHNSTAFTHVMGNSSKNISQELTVNSVHAANPYSPGVAKVVPTRIIQENKAGGRGLDISTTKSITLEMDHARRAGLSPIDNMASNIHNTIVISPTKISMPSHTGRAVSLLSHQTHQNLTNQRHYQTQQLDEPKTLLGINYASGLDKTHGSGLYMLEKVVQQIKPSIAAESVATSTSGHPVDHPYYTKKVQKTNSASTQPIPSVSISEPTTNDVSVVSSPSIKEPTESNTLPQGDTLPHALKRSTRKSSTDNKFLDMPPQAEAQSTGIDKKRTPRTKRLPSKQTEIHDEGPTNILDEASVTTNTSQVKECTSEEAASVKSLRVSNRSCRGSTDSNVSHGSSVQGDGETPRASKYRTKKAKEADSTENTPSTRPTRGSARRKATSENSTPNAADTSRTTNSRASKRKLMSDESVESSVKKVKESTQIVENDIISDELKETDSLNKELSVDTTSNGPTATKPPTGRTRGRKPNVTSNNTNDVKKRGNKKGSKALPVLETKDSISDTKSVECTAPISETADVEVTTKKRRATRSRKVNDGNQEAIPSVPTKRRR